MRTCALPLVPILLRESKEENKTPSKRTLFFSFPRKKSSKREKVSNKRGVMLRFQEIERAPPGGRKLFSQNRNRSPVLSPLIGQERGSVTFGELTEPKRACCLRLVVLGPWYHFTAAAPVLSFILLAILLGVRRAYCCTNQENFHFSGVACLPVKTRGSLAGKIQGGHATFFLGNEKVQFSFRLGLTN